MSFLVYFDLLYTLAFVIFYGFLRFSYEKVIQDKEVVYRTRDFSCEVSGLPEKGITE